MSYLKKAQAFVLIGRISIFTAVRTPRVLKKKISLILLTFVLTFVFFLGNFAHANPDTLYLSLTDFHAPEEGTYRIELAIESSLDVPGLLEPLRLTMQSDDDSGYLVKNSDAKAYQIASAIGATPRLVLASSNFKSSDHLNSWVIRVSIKSIYERLQASKIKELASLLGVEVPAWKMGFRISKYNGFFKGYQVIQTSSAVEVASLDDLSITELVGKPHPLALLAFHSAVILDQADGLSESSLAWLHQRKAGLEAQRIPSPSTCWGLLTPTKLGE